MMPRRSTRDYFDLAGIRQMPFAMTDHLFEPLVFEWPSEGTELSDAAAYMAVKLLAGSERSRRYPGDFDSNGNLRTIQVPLGPTMQIYAHGSYYFPVYRGYYVLCGGARVGHYGECPQQHNTPNGARYTQGLFSGARNKIGSGERSCALGYRATGCS